MEAITNDELVAIVEAARELSQEPDYCAQVEWSKMLQLCSELLAFRNARKHREECYQCWRVFEPLFPGDIHCHKCKEYLYERERVEWHE